MAKLSLVTLSRAQICLCAIALSFFSFEALSAGIWEADKIAAFTTQNVRLLDSNKKAVAVVPVAQIRSLIAVKDRLSSVAGVYPKLVITEGDSPNAFASNSTGTNVIAFNTAMLRFLGSDNDALAAVMGHEMGHLVKGHLQEKGSRDALLGIVGFALGLALDYKIANRTGVASDVGQNLGAIGATLVSYKFDRDQEREADSVGVEWMNVAGYDPAGALRLWERMQSGSIGFFSDHPTSAERLENIGTQIAGFGPKRQTVLASTAPNIGKSQTSSVTSISEFKEATSTPDDPIVLGLRAFRERRFTDAFNFATLAAEKSDPRGQLGLGYLYFYGLGTAKDYKKAADWFALAAAQDSATANTFLGIMHENGYGFRKDFGEAAAYYQKASDAGFPSGMARLAQMKLLGLGIPKDTAGAVELAQKAAVSNDTMANFVLGLAYYRGDGIRQDFAEAKLRFEKASQSGFVLSDSYLGEMYALGKGVTQDYPEAVRLFKKAALKGNAAAKANLGFLYLRGNGVQRDYDEARRLFEEAFRTGQIIAPFGLGLIYRNGLGVTADQARALAYFDYSARKGYATATKFRNELAAKLSESELQRSHQISLEIAGQAGI